MSSNHRIHIAIHSTNLRRRTAAVLPLVRRLAAPLLAGFLALLPAAAGADGALQAWERRYDGPGSSDDVATTIAVDRSNRVVVAGWSVGNEGNYDYATLAYSSTGAPLWTNRYSGPGHAHDWATAVAVDAEGNVVVTGYSARNSTEPYNYDYATIKYSSSGGAQWTNWYCGSGSGDNVASALAVDAAGNVVVTGYSTNAGTGYDYTTVKYSSTGVPLWTNWYRGPGSGDDRAMAVALDAAGHVFVTGCSTNSSQGYDYVTVAYGADGTPSWMQTYNGPHSWDDQAAAIAVDAQGNVVVTGTSEDDWVTLKYSAGTGTPVWTNTCAGPAHLADHPLALDAGGNVYVTGWSGNGDYSEFRTVAYRSTGEAWWTSHYNGPGNRPDEAAGVAVDAAGNVYVTGRSMGLVYGDYAYTTVGYAPGGVGWWTNRYDGPGSSYDLANALAVDSQGNVYVTGRSVGAGTGFDFATLKYVPPPLITTEPASRTNVVGTTATFAVAATGAAPLSYQWIKNGTEYLADGGKVSGAHSNTLRLVNVQPEEAGSYSVRVVNPGGAVLSSSATLTVLAAPETLAAWVQRYNGPGNGSDYASALAVDGSGNVFVTGYSVGVGSLFDYATIGYRGTDGTPLWTNRYNGPGNSPAQATALAVDGSGNVFVTGRSYGVGSLFDYATIGYRGSDGTPLWTNWYNGPRDGYDYAHALAVDGSGNVFVTGHSFGVGSGYDYATIGYRATDGTPLWTNWYNGPGNGQDSARALAVDGSGNVFVTGHSRGVGSGYDYATIGYRGTDGTPLWTNRYNGPANGDDWARALAVDGSGNVFVTGFSWNGTDDDCATIKYVPPPVILTHPASRTNAAGTTASFTVAAMGGGPFDYQWVKNGTNYLTDGGNVSGAWSSTLVLNNVQEADAGTYTVLVANLTGAAWSSPAALTVVPIVDPVVITTQPASRTNMVGTTATFAVAATGAAPLSYQWVKNGTQYLTDAGNVSGALTPTLVLNNVQEADAGTYTVRVTNLTSAAWSSPATLTVVPIVDPVVITTQPASRTNMVGSTATFAVAATGAAPLSYQWVKNGTQYLTDAGNISGSRTATLVLSNVEETDAGTYAVLVTNLTGAVLSSNATLTVLAASGPELWARHYSESSHGGDLAQALVVDAEANVYVTGSSLNVGEVNADYATIKYSSEGVALWTNRYNGPNDGEDRALAMALGAGGQVYVTGCSLGEVDEEYATLGYSGGGELLWSNRCGGIDAPAEARAVAAGANGNVYVTGFTYPNYGYPDYMTIAYSSGGVALWTNSYNGPGDGEDMSAGVAVDGEGSVYVAGSSSASSGNTDYATIKYSSAGAALWTNWYEGPAGSYDSASAVVVDGANNVYVTGASVGSGSSFDYATIKYSSAGAVLWTQRYNGPANSQDSATALAVHNWGDVVVAGSSVGANGYPDYATIKYSSAGEPLWTNRYNGPANDSDEPAAVAVDAWGNVYVTGYSYNAAGNKDCLTVGYTSGGEPLCTNRYTGPGQGDDAAADVGVDSAGNVYVTGYSWNGTDSDYLTLKYASAAGLRITYTLLSGGSLVFGGTGGTPGGTYYVVASTNVTQPMSDWEPLAVDTFASGGTFSVTNALDPAQPRQFFRLQLP